jgi:hypothetical protein
LGIRGALCICALKCCWGTCWVCAPAGEFQIKIGMHQYSGFIAGNNIPKSIRRLLIHIERPTMLLVVALWHVAWVACIFWIWELRFSLFAICPECFAPPLLHSRGCYTGWCRRCVCVFVCTSTCGLVAMTSASHAEGRQFDPGQV